MLRWAMAGALAGAVAWASPVRAAERVFPGDAWDEAEPEEQFVDGERLDEAMAYLASECGEAGTTQAMVVRNGWVIWQGDDVDAQHNVWSVSKSFTSTVLGLLVDDGLCTLDTLAADHDAALAADYDAVQLRHFATMTSGYDGGGDQSSTPFTPTAPLFAPGTEFQYWDSAMNEFAHVLTRIAGEPIEDVFRTRIAEPIGMHADAWDWQDFGQVDGIVVNGGAGNMSRGIHISASELARLGHLFLARGNWDGTQLFPAAWVDEASTPQVAANIPAHTAGAYGPGVYGLNWWVNGVQGSGERYWPSAPAGTYAARGFNNNQLFVVPEWDMVIVRLGVDGNIDNAVYDTFFGMLAEAVMEIPGEGTTSGDTGSDDGGSEVSGHPPLTSTSDTTSTSTTGTTSETPGDGTAGAEVSGGTEDAVPAAGGDGCGCRSAPAPSLGALALFAFFGVPRRTRGLGRRHVTSSPAHARRNPGATRSANLSVQVTTPLATPRGEAHRRRRAQMHHLHPHERNHDEEGRSEPRPRVVQLGVQRFPLASVQPASRSLSGERARPSDRGRTEPTR